MLDTANYLYQHNALAKQIIDLPISFLFAEGLTIQASSKRAKKIIDSFWQDDINNLEHHIPDYIRHLSLSGELCLAVYQNHNHMRVVLIPSNVITHVEPDPENCTRPNIVHVRSDDGYDDILYNVIEYDDNLSAAAHSKRHNVTRSCFYFAINTLFPDLRGKSQLLPLADMIDSYQKFIMGEMQRAKAMRWFAWHRKVKGITKQQLQHLSGAMPSPGSVLTTNEQEEWTPLTLNLGGQDSQNFAKIFRNFTLGGAGLPVHWFGGADDVNRATAIEMNTPVFKQLTMQQKQCGRIIKRITQHILDIHNTQATITIDWPELAAQDTQHHAQSLHYIVQSVNQQIKHKLITRKTGMRLIASIAERLGVTYNVEDELMNLTADIANNAPSNEGNDYGV